MMPEGAESERKGSPKWSKIRVFYVKNRKKAARGAPDVDLEYFLGGFWGMRFFDDFWDVQESRKIQKKSLFWAQKGV